MNRIDYTQVFITIGLLISLIPGLIVAVILAFLGFSLIVVLAPISISLGLGALWGRSVR